jgi:hypothetical protein
MSAADQAFGWQEAMVAFTMILIAAFLVTWVVTDLLRIARTAYVAILALTIAALSAGYIAWSGTSVSELVESGWWGLAAGLVAASVAAPLIGRLPPYPRAAGRRLAWLFVWEGVVYGTAEAILLATLPVLAVWQGASAAGWSGRGWAKVVSGSLAIAGALLVILVHHVGYGEFRRTAARPKLAGALFTCGVQGLAFLVTGNVIAPIVAHILLHAQMILRGIELPPQTPETEEPSRDWAGSKAPRSRVRRPPLHASVTR